MKYVRILVFVSMLLLVTGCEDDTSDKVGLIERIEFNDLDKDVERYIDESIMESGIYLINTDDKEYLLLSNRSVVNGEDAGYFSDVYAEFSEGKLDIYFEEHFVEDYSDKHLEDNMMIYLIHDNPDREYILAHKNGVEVPFDVIFGI